MSGVSGLFVRTRVAQSASARCIRLMIVVLQFDEKLGNGAYKDVFLAYDTETGKEVAWNAVNLARLPPNEKRRIRMETEILRDLVRRTSIQREHAAGSGDVHARSSVCRDEHPGATRILVGFSACVYVWFCSLSSRIIRTSLTSLTFGTIQKEVRQQKTGRMFGAT